MLHSRLFWALAVSAGIHAAALHWGGQWIDRSGTPVAAPERLQIALRIAATPPSEPPSETLPMAAPPRPTAKRAAAQPPVTGTVPIAQIAPEPRRQNPVQPTLREEARREPPLTAEAAEFRRPAAPRTRPNRPAPRAAEEMVARPNPPEPEETLVYPETPADYAALVSSVRSRIDGTKRYPRLARRAGFEGRTLLKFKILPDGRVTEIRVLETSQFEMLDEAAMRAVERAAPFQEEGRQIRGKFIEVILPVVFQLR